MENTCTACFHCKGSQESTERLPEYFECELDNVLHHGRFKCVNFNRGVSGEKICFNCTNFLGGADWGLSCKDDYYKICSALDVACDKFNQKHLIIT